MRLQLEYLRPDFECPHCGRGYKVRATYEDSDDACGEHEVNCPACKGKFWLEPKTVWTATAR